MQAGQLVWPARLSADYSYAAIPVGAWVDWPVVLVAIVVGVVFVAGSRVAGTA